MPLSLLKRFARDRSANVTLLFGLSLIPMIGVAGLGVDYGIALSAKSKLDNAADTAAIAAVATADRKSTRLNSSHSGESRMPSSA